MSKHIYPVGKWTSIVKYEMKWRSKNKKLTEHNDKMTQLGILFPFMWWEKSREVKKNSTVIVLQL